MTLQNIREIRLRRQKPASMVDIIIGEAPSFCKRSPDVIELLPGCDPQLMDWRPLVGLWVCFYLVNEDWDLMYSALKAVDKSGAKLFGFACREYAHPLIDFVDEVTEKRAERALNKNLRLLCKQ